MKRALRLSLALLVCALAFSALLPGGIAPAQAAPLARPASLLSDSLVAYWKLEEASGTRLDELTGCGGAGCDLTDNNTVTQNTGKVGSAGQFTRANSEYLSRADHADLSTADIDFSFTAWVYMDSAPAGNMNILTKQDSGTVREYSLLWFQASNQFQVNFFNSSGTNIGSRAFSTTLSTGTWYFIYAAHDATNNLAIINVNNGTVESTSTSGAPSDTNAVFRMGAINTTATTFWDGRIDAVGFWKRVLTADEQTCLYNAGAGIEYPFTACGATATPTNTPTRTDTPTVTLTHTPTDTFTPTVTHTPTVTETPTITLTPTDTATSTATATATSSVPTDTPTVTPTGTVTPTPTVTLTAGPDYWYELPLSSGNILRIERRWSYGELFIGALLVVVAIVLLVRFGYDFVSRWF